jgi:hypothetical protein
MELSVTLFVDYGIVIAELLYDSAPITAVMQVLYVGKCHARNVTEHLQRRMWRARFVYCYKHTGDNEHVVSVRRVTQTQ